MVLYNTGILFNIKNQYSEAIEELEKSIEHNKSNIYAYLALGDALERLKTPEHNKRALKVYKELNEIGTKVHGLDKKIQYLEAQIIQDEKIEAGKRDKMVYQKRLEDQKLKEE